MENFRNTAFLLSLASLSLMGGDLFAQSDNLRLGYCTTDYSRSLVAQGQTGSHIYQAAIYLTSDQLDKYEGDKIESVEFAIKPVRGQSASVFVCTDIKDLKNTLITTATTKEHKEGWNKVDLRKPVTIKKGMNLYVGYQILIGEDEDYDCLLFDNSPYGLKGLNWYGLDDKWFNNIAGIDHNLCIRAVVSGDNFPENDVTLIRIDSEDGGDYVTQNTPKTYYAYVQNNGSKPVKSLTLSTLSKTSTVEKADDIAYDDLDIPNNEPTKLKLSNVAIPVEGNFTTTFSVSKVNGEADPYPADNSVERVGFSIKEGTTSVSRNVLFEEFTAEGSEDGPAADEMHNKVIEDKELDYVIWVKHHRNFRNVDDKFVIAEDNDYSELYGTSSPFVPASCFDRLVVSGMEDSGPAYYIPYDEQLATFFGLAKAQPSFVSLEVVPNVSADGKTLNVEVKGHAGTNEMPLQTDLRLTTWLVEDGIVSNTQVGADDYVQNGVVRKVLSGNAWGDKLDISNYDFSKNFSVAIDPEWNVKNMRVVSFVSNYDKSAFSRRVYNSAQASCQTSTGISQLGASGSQPFAVSGGRVFVNQGFRLIGVCDLAGRKVSADNLSNGIYIVQTTDGKQLITQKICIKR